MFRRLDIRLSALLTTVCSTRPNFSSRITRLSRQPPALFRVTRVRPSRPAVLNPERTIPVLVLALVNLCARLRLISYTGAVPCTPPDVRFWPRLCKNADSGEFDCGLDDSERRQRHFRRVGNKKRAHEKVHIAPFYAVWADCERSERLSVRPCHDGKNRLDNLSQIQL